MRSVNENFKKLAYLKLGRFSIVCPSYCAILLSLILLVSCIDSRVINCVNGCNENPAINVDDLFLSFDNLSDSCINATVAENWTGGTCANISCTLNGRVSCRQSGVRYIDVESISGIVYFSRNVCQCSVGELQCAECPISRPFRLQQGVWNFCHAMSATCANSRICNKDTPANGCDDQYAWTCRNETRYCALNQDACLQLPGCVRNVNNSSVQSNSVPSAGDVKNIFLYSRNKKSVK